MTREEILNAVKSGKLNTTEALAQLTALEPTVAPRALSCKVSEKSKALSIYGLNAKWPVTLYVEQWERLLAFAEQIKVFAKAHPELSRKHAA